MNEISYYIRHKQKILDYQKQYIRANKDKIKEYQKIYFKRRYADLVKKKLLIESTKSRNESIKNDPQKHKQRNEYCKNYMRKYRQNKDRYIIEKKKPVKKKVELIIKYPCKICYIETEEWFIIRLDNW